MKRLFTLAIVCFFSISFFAQETDTIPEIPAVPEVPEIPEVSEASETRDYADTVKVMNKVEVIETPESTKVTLGENEVLIIEENGDTVRVVLGSRGISIVEGDDGTEIKVMEMDDYRKSSDKKHVKKFKPHYAGLEAGMNNYVTPGFSMVLPPDQRYMDLNTGKSWNWNINVFDYGFGFGTDKIGIVSGLGFEFINYNLDGQNSIRKDPETGETIEYIPDYAGNITKSKINMTYVTAPLLIEFQIPTGHKRVYISAGVVGGLKLWSNTKTKYTVSGEKSKEKAKGDYNLSPLRWGLTARLGYRSFGFYANYYMTPLFKPTLGPELYPFAVGFAFSF